MNQKNIIIVLLTALLFFCVLAPVTAAGKQEQSSSSTGPINLTFYTYNYMSQQKEGVDLMISEFQEANENVTVEIVYLGATDISAKIQADIAAGITPDIIQVVFSDLDYSINNFGIKDLNKIVDKAELESHLEGFEPAALDVARLDGKLYGLPYTFSTPVLFYNADIWRDAGLDPEKPPKTWEETSEYARIIKENTGNEGFVFGGTTGYDWLLQGIIKSNGGEILSEDRKTLLFAEEPAIEAITMLSDMKKSGGLSTLTDMQGMEAFPQGNVGMMLFTSAVQAYFISSAQAGGWELRTSYMPTYGNKPAVPVNSGSGIFICSDDPAKQQAAWKFVKFATSKRGYTIITTKMGYPPLRPGIVEDERYLKQWAIENPLVKPNLDQLKIVDQWESYPGNNYKQILTILMDAFTKIIFTGADVEETMTEAQTRAQSLMPN